MRDVAIAIVAKVAIFAALMTGLARRFRDEIRRTDAAMRDRLLSMKDIRERFGKAVRRLRLGRGQSQEAFAARAKIDPSYMGQIERGEVNISLDSIEKIAKALQVTVGKLMTEMDCE